MTPARSAPFALVLCTAFLAGCPDKATPGSADAGVAASHVDAGPPELTFTLTGQVADAGTEVPIPADVNADAPALIPQLQALRVQTNLPLQNYRVRVFDEADRAMVSDDLSNDEPTGTRYEITFPTPLKSGHKYVVAIDAQTGVQFTDSFGRLHPDVRIRLQVEGEKQKDPPPAKKPSRKRRR